MTIVYLANSPPLYLTEQNDIVTYVSLSGSALTVYGLGGDDQIGCGGGLFPILIFGGDGNDTIGGLGGPTEPGVTLYGEAGNDQLYGTVVDLEFSLTGFSLLDGGTGDDTIVGGSRGDTILGGDGNDWIKFAGNGSFGGAICLAGAGNDTIDVQYFSAKPYGGTGDDVIFGSSFNDILSGDEGIDLLIGRAGNDYLYLGAGGGTAFGDTALVGFQVGGNDVGVGADDADNFIMGDGNDAAYGYGGRDYLLGEGGNDTLIAGDGNDVIYGGTGINFMYGDGGDDVFISEGSADQMEGGSGHNYFYRYGAGTSYATGGASIDEFIGDAFASNDTVLGLAGNDYLFGGGGNDLLEGGADNDVILGQAGNDTLNGGSGVNLLWANDAGNDQVLVNVADGGTQVLEFFEAGGTNDVVRLLGSSLTSFADFEALKANIGNVVGTNLLVNAGSGAQLYLNLGVNQTAIWFQGVSAYSLTSGDFLFG
jgi:Ca2+-binding RTX toxin-like protein